MKKVIKRKLALSKETVTCLEASDLVKVGGGTSWTADLAQCGSSMCGDTI